jgi:hypothetical protein
MSHTWLLQVSGRLLLYRPGVGQHNIRAAPHPSMAILLLLLLLLLLL